jgi:hypothetical protein
MNRSLLGTKQLRTRGEQPCRRAAEQTDEIAASHMSGSPINPKVPQSKQRCLGTHKAVRMSGPGTNAKSWHVRFVAALGA